ncbi:MAG: kelch repeat-containing protein [Robiginitomaculum sp.]|nr:kelch repeat-containing protein [Robiginitomaculum sp.]MDQ7076865.1 kelch repeat-containing protein [Robiginitomaculum sp.]
MRFSISLLTALTSLLLGCTATILIRPPHGVIATLPVPISNAAIARVGDTAYVFAGLHAGKTWRDVTADAYACDLAGGVCRAIAPLPDGEGRLAANAVTLGEKIYIFGGYRVAKDGTEKSTPEVWVFDPKDETYTRAPDMPVPVDDAVVLGFVDRYAVLISGWHDTDNVADVQVLDTRENRWFAINAYPGAPVFGHAGAISGDHLLICGGVKVVPPVPPQKRRHFVLSESCWAGRISENAQNIIWTKAGDTAPGAAYRRAAVALSDGDFLFYGGALNPYNYDGIGYDGEPSMPLARMDVARFDADGNLHWWQDNAPSGMDYRGGILWHGALITIGGMDETQTVMDAVYAMPLPPRQ